jgi:hypothetical protein
MRIMFRPFEWKTLKVTGPACLANRRSFSPRREALAHAPEPVRRDASNDGVAAAWGTNPED